MKKAFLKVAGFILIAVLGFMVFGFYRSGYIPSELNEGQVQTELTDVGSPYKFYFSRLDNEEKTAYNLILKEIYSMPGSIEINRISYEQADRVFEALLNDNPDLFFVGRRCSVSTKGSKTTFSVEYTVEKSEYPEMKKQIDGICETVMASFTDISDEWQTELEIHDYIIDNCEYQLDNGNGEQSTVYGALVEGKAACEGYSKAAKLLLDKAGIFSAVVSGMAENESGEVSPHMWNAVKIDGNYYYLDCTWDDPVSDDGSDSKTYFHFNLDRESLSQTHSDFSYDFECNSTSGNYFVRTGAYFEAYGDGCKDRIVELIADAAENGRDYVYIRFANEKAYGDAVEDLIENEEIYNLLKRAKKQTDADFSTTATGYFEQSERLIIAFVPKYE